VVHVSTTLSATAEAEKIMVALDVDGARARELGEALAGSGCWVKIGMTLFYAEGPQIVRYFKERGFKVFLDLKFHDIPHQVRGAAASAAGLGVDLLTTHGLGGKAMLAAAVEGAATAAVPPAVIAITVLTSMDAESLASVGVTGPLDEEVTRLATLAREAGCQGVVCSPQEAGAMRALLGPGALVVTPGVRPAGAAVGDQARVATPAAALAAGASHVVIGRPITGAQNPVQAFEEIVKELMDKGEIA
jgi:orotidine-5'-phosphate decarboxylase